MFPGDDEVPALSAMMMYDFFVSGIVMSKYHQAVIKFLAPGGFPDEASIKVNFTL